MLTYKELNTKAKEIEKNTGLQHLEIYQRYMFERLLERISVSRYSENFILKGGLLLSAIFGINNRSTRDMDVTIKGIDISKEKMLKVLNEILLIDLNDGVKFEVIKVTDIREDDKYGGNKYQLVGKLENLKINLEIDISTGDVILPKDLKYTYSSIFENKQIYIDSYNNETILSEKIETILRRGKYNTRMKDYYDVYMFLTKLKNEINMQLFKKCFNKIIIKRESEEYLRDYKKILNEISNDERMNTYWNKYRNKNNYARDIDFNNIINLVKTLIKNLNLL